MKHLPLSLSLALLTASPLSPCLTLLLELLHLGLADALDERELLLGRVGERLDRADAALAQLLDIDGRDTVGL